MLLEWLSCFSVLVYVLHHQRLSVKWRPWEAAETLDQRAPAGGSGAENPKRRGGWRAEGERARSRSSWGALRPPSLIPSETCVGVDPGRTCGGGRNGHRKNGTKRTRRCDGQGVFMLRVCPYQSDQDVEPNFQASCQDEHRPGEYEQPSRKARF